MGLSRNTVKKYLVVGPGDYLARGESQRLAIDLHHCRFIALIHGKKITYPKHLAQFIFHAHSGTGDDAGRVPWVKETEIVWPLT